MHGINGKYMQNQIWKLKCTYTLEIGLFIYTISKSKYITGIVWYTNHSHALSVYMHGGAVNRPTRGMYKQ